MKLMNIANAGLRLLVSPITGVLAAYKEADSRPKAENWKQFIWNDVKDYFMLIRLAPTARNSGE